MLILTGVVLLFLFSALYYVKYKQEKLMLEESQKQFNKEVNSLFAFKTSTLKQVAYDYTYWDDFVQNIKIKDTEWFENNITTILKSYHIEYVCVYDSSFTLIHDASSTGADDRGIITKETIIELKKAKFLNFFQNFSGGVIEISGASVHPDNDPTHTLTKPSGYLFLVKRWDKPFLEDLTILSGAEIKLFKVSDSVTKGDKYSISNAQKLLDWNNNLVAQLIFTRTSDYYKLYHSMSVYMLLIILGSIFTTLLIFHFVTRKWINKPLKLITNILKSDNPTLIKELQRCPGEFKNIGDLICEFLIQKNELIQAKDKAEESDRLKTAFLTNMSHEIRTPMNGILGFADLLKSVNLSGEKQQEFIGIIETSGKRMLNIINDIINISKVEAGMTEINISESDISEQTEYIYAFFKLEVEQKGLQFILKNTLPASGSIIKTDREKIYAILTNLVKNAIKFTSKGFIEFGYEKKGKYLEFFVKDSGIGIRQEQMEFIFDRFRQGSESLTRNYEGSGLGLSISKAYVEMLGGKIWIESEETKGSTFYFTIPYITEQSGIKIIKTAVKEIKEKYHIVNLKILIVEDDETTEKLIKTIVEKYSKEILIARNGVEAILICRNNPDIDLVLMDIKMPQMNGYEATKQIRQFNKSVIIFAQTAYALPGDRDKAIEAGCNDYISKPYSQDLFAELMERTFNK